ncbi:MAG: RNA polymerase sigma factor [Clostridia bacterium]|nr:RNA polymerase sigma factor [Clostridia bacterium]
MRREDAERTISEYIKPVFGFALKRCRNAQDAEDVSQDIVLRAYRALLCRDDIADVGRFIWTVAHHTLANYYRDRARSDMGVTVDIAALADVLVDPDTFVGADDTAESIARLRQEIAYLSKTQRRIVIAYYFENKKQDAIARELGIPLGTVKWHLFEAKKELKRGMEVQRQASDLKFNPIKFYSCGFNGSAGKVGVDTFFRSPLPQNICYCVRREAKTVNDIADALGVSPVYVESEVEHLEQYGLLIRQGERYLANILLSEPTAELLTMQNEMYRRASVLFANALYDRLTSSGILEDERIICHQTDGEISLWNNVPTDRNFLLWALIPYIAARAGESGDEYIAAEKGEGISFEEVATLRPDGGHNICHATVVDENMVLPEDHVYMKNWCGPSWNTDSSHMIWRIDSEWSERRVRTDRGEYDDATRVLQLYRREDEQPPLAKEEYAWLAERGFIKTNGDFEGHLKVCWQVVQLMDKEIERQLLTIGEDIKRELWQTFEALKAPYVEAVLSSLPSHMRRMKAYELQYTFHSDGWFLLHCLRTLLDNGKLKPPTEGQRKALTTLIVPLT